MKKKRNFLTIISSILGVLTICSFSMFFIFNRSDKKTNSVEAAVSRNLFRLTQSTTDITYKTDVTLRISYLIEYNKYYDGSNPSYGFYCRVTYDYVATINSNRYIVRDYLDYNSMLSYEYEFLKSDTPLDSGTQVSFYLDSTTVNTYFVPTYSQTVDNIFSYSVNGSFVRGYDKFFRVSVRNNSGGTSSQNISIIDNQEPFLLKTFMLSINDGANGSFDEGYDAGFEQGYNSGQSDGYSNGYDIGYQEGLNQGNLNNQNSYQSGYADGYAAADNQDSIVTSIFSGILQVALVPVNFFLSIFNFEILGINLSAFIRAIFTVVLTIIVIKTVMGKGGGGSDN